MSDDLIERLREVGGMSDDGATRWYINPDGPEAASRIEKLEAALKHCIDALKEYEMGDDRPRGPIPNDDLRPWLLGAMDNAIKVMEGKDD